MSHPDPNGAPDRRPIKVGEVWENPVTGERSVILERPWDNPASRVTGELTALVGARVMELALSSSALPHEPIIQVLCRVASPHCWGPAL
jgi:hypothetical protein